MIETLKLLLGNWEGEGTATFPTIAQQDYLEKLSFALDEPHSAIQYEQKTWRKESKQLLHWEFGFIRVREDQSLLVNNVQSNGRTEAMTGHATLTETGLLLSLTTSAFGSDPRMLAAARELSVEGDVLTYTQSMATQTVPDAKTHLHAVLRKR